MTTVTIELSTIEQIMKTLCDTNVANKEFSELACYMDGFDEYKVMEHLNEVAEKFDAIYYELRTLTGLDPRKIDKISSFTRYLDLNVEGRYVDWDQLRLMQQYEAAANQALEKPLEK